MLRITKEIQTVQDEFREAVANLPNSKRADAWEAFKSAIDIAYSQGIEYGWRNPYREDMGK